MASNLFQLMFEGEKDTNTITFDIDHEKTSFVLYMRYVPKYIKDFFDLILLYIHHVNVNIYLNGVDIKYLINIPNYMENYIEICNKHNPNIINWAGLSKNSSVTLFLLRKYDGWIYELICKNIKLDKELMVFLKDLNSKQKLDDQFIHHIF